MQKKLLAAVCAVLMTVSAGASLTAPVKASAAESIAGTSAQNYINEVAALVNQERAAQGLSALNVVPALNQAAEIRAQETVTNFSHTRPDGRSCSTVLDEAGVTWRTTGENIAYGYSTPADVMNGWMNSSGHRANILNANFDSVGIGVVSQNGVLYWTQVFTGGTSAGTPEKTAETPGVSVPSLPETTNTYTVPCIGENCPVTTCTGENCNTDMQNLLSCLTQNCNNGNCIIGGKSCTTAQDVLSALGQNCSGGNCVVNGTNCNTAQDVLSALGQNCTGGNCIINGQSCPAQNLLSALNGNCSNGNCLPGNMQSILQNFCK